MLVLGTEAFRWLALLLLFFAPFPVFVALKKQLRNQATLNSQMFAKAEVNLKFGPASSLTSSQRKRAAEETFDRLETEILARNFKNAGELIALAEFIPDIMKQCYAGGSSPSSQSYAAWWARLTKALELARKHQAGLG